MGLDSVELVLETEHEFGITITDPEAVACATVGDLHRLICRKLGVPTRDCWSNLAFYEVRRQLVERLGYSKRELRPGTRLADLIPEHDRRKLWPEVPAAPRLARSGRTQSLIISGGLLVGWLCALFAAGAGGASAFVAFCLGALTTYVVLVRATRARAVHVAGDTQTIGDLARRHLSANEPALLERFKGRRDAGVWLTVRQIVAEQLGQPKEKVTPTARFVDDLGMV